MKEPCADAWRVEDASGALLGPAEARCDGTAWHLVVDGAPVRVTVDWRAIDGVFHGSLTLTGEAAAVHFPYRRCTGLEDHDELLVGSAGGDRLQPPSLAVERYCRLERRPAPKGITFIEHLDERWELRYRYPAMLAVQLAVLHNPVAGLGIACLGTGTATRDLCVRAIDPATTDVSFRHPVSATTWTAPPAALIPTEGGWEEAARRYADLMATRLPPADPPAWMRQSFHGWLQVMMAYEGREARWRFADLPQLMATALDLGVNVLHVAGWSGTGHDTAYPDFTPNPALGTEADLRTAMAAIKAMGGRAVLYTNGRLVDPRSAFAQRGGDGWLCRRPDGSLAHENWGNSVDFAVACPSCTGYREHLAGETERLVGRYGCHAVQIDQIASMPAVDCHDPAHGHVHFADNFLGGLLDLLADVRRRIRAIDPAAFVWVEGQNDLLGTCYDVAQGGGENGGGWSVHAGGTQPDLVPLACPERLVTGSCDSTQQIARTWLQGKAFDLSYAVVDDPVRRALVRRCIALREAHAAHLMRGRFRGGAGVISDGRLRLGRFTAAGADDLLAIQAIGVQPGQAATGTLRPEPGTVLEPIDGLELERDGSAFRCRFEGPIALAHIR